MNMKKIALFSASGSESPDSPPALRIRFTMWPAFPT